LEALRNRTNVCNNPVLTYNGLCGGIWGVLCCVGEEYCISWMPRSMQVVGLLSGGSNVIYIYIKAKPADFVCIFVCVLLGDGSGGVFFLVSFRSVSYW
jgi:hypothetical protein